MEGWVGEEEGGDGEGGSLGVDEGEEGEGEIEE